MEVIVIISGAILLIYKANPKRESGGNGANVSIYGGKRKDNDLFSLFF